MPAAKEYEAVPASDETIVASTSSSKIAAKDFDEEETRLGSYEEDEDSELGEEGEFSKPRRQHLEELNHEDPLSADHETWTDYTEAEEKKVLKKLDRRVVLFVALLYLLSFLDRSNIGNARIAGLERDLRLTSDQYEWLLTAFYISYILFEWMALLYVGISRCVPRQSRVLIWKQVSTYPAAYLPRMLCNGVGYPRVATGNQQFLRDTPRLQSSAGCI